MSVYIMARKQEKEPTCSSRKPVSILLHCLNRILIVFIFRDMGNCASPAPHCYLTSNNLYNTLSMKEPECRLSSRWLNKIQENKAQCFLLVWEKTNRKAPSHTHLSRRGRESLFLQAHRRFQLSVVHLFGFSSFMLPVNGQKHFSNSLPNQETFFSLLFRNSVY